MKLAVEPFLTLETIDKIICPQGPFVAVLELFIVSHNLPGQMEFAQLS